MNVRCSAVAPAERRRTREAPTLEFIGDPFGSHVQRARPPARALGARLSAAALVVVAAALLGAPPAGAAPPQHGVLVPGQSLGGLRLGMTKAQVKARWGTGFGRCRDCFYATWYYNYRPFEPQGAGVEFELGKVRRIFTIWQPPGWRTSEGMALGAPVGDVTERYGTLPRKQCLRYTVFLERAPGAVTAFYVYDDRLWGFGLMRPDLAACV